MSQEHAFFRRRISKRPMTTMARVLSNPVPTAVILVVSAALVGGFAYIRGRLTPERLNATILTDALEAGDHPHPGFRRAHAKGICFSGQFVGNPSSAAITKAAVFGAGTVSVIGRFAHGTPNPYAPDSSNDIRSMALRLLPDGGDEWRTGMNNTPGLSTSEPGAFFEQLVASKPDPRTGKPDPARMGAFLAAHPESVAFNKRSAAKPLASGFTNDSYDSLNSFVFVDARGRRRLVRWTMRAMSPFSTLSPGSRAEKSPNYAFDDLIQQVRAGPLRWHLIATLAAKGDRARAAEVWPTTRQTVDMGELTIDHVESERSGNCQDLNFDPLVLPEGIEPSDDPILYARSAVYSESIRRRAGEQRPTRAVSNGSVGASR